MLPLLALIPGLLFTGAKYVGPLVMDHQAVLETGLKDLLLKSPTGAKIVSFFESVIGPIADDKKEQFTLDLDSMLGNLQVDTIEAEEPKKDPRRFLFWGLDTIVLLQLGMAEVSNLLALYHGQPLAPLDSMTIVLLGTLLGAHLGSKVVEKVNSNQDNN